MTEQKKCKNCSMQLSEKATMCPKCGEEFQGQQPNEVNEAEAQLSTEYKEEVINGRKRYVGLAIRTFVAFLISSFVVSTISSAAYSYIPYKNKVIAVVFGIVVGLLCARIGKRLFKNRVSSTVFQIVGLLLGTLLTSFWWITYDL